MIEDWNSYEKALSWFEQANCKGEENCVFHAYRDLGKHILASHLIGEVAGDIAEFASRIAFNEIDKMLNDLENYLYYLVNETEKGIAIIPIESNGLSYKKAKPLPEKCVFIPKEAIQKIQLKNYTLFYKSAQNLIIRATGVPEIRINVNVKDRFLSFQEENFKRFMKKYKK